MCMCGWARGAECTASKQVCAFKQFVCMASCLLHSCTSGRPYNLLTPTLFFCRIPRGVPPAAPGMLYCIQVGVCRQVCKSGELLDLRQQQAKTVADHHHPYL